MLAAARLGRAEDALAAYRRADRLFRDELGVEPGAELRRLQQLVLSGQVAPAVSPRVRPAATPPPAEESPAPAEVHLPRRRTRLLGRDPELADLAFRLSAASTVTIVGAGGCGKTTLAVATAEQVTGDFPDGVWFVDLSSVQDAAALGTPGAPTLGLAGDGTSSVADTLRVFTRNRRMLLILDNCEHILDPAAQLVEDLPLDGGRPGGLAPQR